MQPLHSTKSIRFCEDRSSVTDLSAAALLIGARLFGVKAVTRETEGRLAVDDGGLGETPPRGDPPAVMVCTSCTVSIFSSLCSVT